MANLVARSGLEHLASADHSITGKGAPGVTLLVRDDIALATVMVRKGQSDALVSRVRERFGIGLSDEPRRAAAGPVAFAWSGPGQWLAMCHGAAAEAFVARLQAELDGLASVADQSDGRVVIRVGGRNARAALAKGVPIDLHPRAFRSGDTAATVVAYIGVHLWQLDETPSYEFAVFRSFAAAFWHWLTNAAAEFGISIEAR